MTIRLTSRRLELLRAVADGRVAEHYPPPPKSIYTLMDRGEGASWPPNRYVKVTAEIARLCRAGLVALDLDQPRDHYRTPRQWRLTNLGEQTLRSNRREPVHD